MPSKKFIWDPQHWRFRARTVADQLHRSSTLNVIARALKRSNLTISDRLKPRWTCVLNFRCHCRMSPVGD
jgi:hypothetical protein